VIILVAREAMVCRRAGWSGRHFCIREYQKAGLLASGTYFVVVRSVVSTASFMASVKLLLLTPTVLIEGMNGR
jgi:hypothetical protein